MSVRRFTAAIVLSTLIAAADADAQDGTLRERSRARMGVTAQVDRATGGETLSYGTDPAQKR